MEIQLLQDEQISVCSLCGEKLSLFGSKAINDGMLCRDCCQLLSPWLTDKEILKMDKEAISNHMSYRENNQLKLQQFNIDVVVEGKYQLFIDQHNNQFVVSRKKDALSENADVVDLSAISEVAFMDEKYKGSDSIDVFFEIRLKGSPFKKIRFRVNDFPGLEKGSQQHIAARAKANEYIQALTTAGGFECNKLQLKRR